MTNTRLAPSFLQSLSPILIVAILLITGYGILGIRIEILLLAAAVLTGLIALRLGYSYEDMQKGINDALHSSMTALLIVTVVGAMIATWIASGTIPMLIYYGLQVISPSYFYVTACLVCSLVSLVTGTSWGAAGTIGIALIGIANGMGLDLAITAGAIISGAYFGDKLSPFSDTTNLAPAATKANLYDHIGHMLWTTVPAYSFALICYVILGLGFDAGNSNTQLAELENGILQHFQIEGYVAFLLLLPAAVTLGGALLKKPVIPAMLLSCLIAWLLAIFLQETPVTFEHGILSEDHWRYQLQEQFWPAIYPLQAMIFGYELHSGIPSLDNLLNRGGMASMMDTLLIALCAFAFAGILNIAGFLNVLLDKLVTVATNTGRLIFSASLSSMVIAVCTGNSYLSILLPGKLFSDTFSERKLAAKNLSRTTEDSGTVIVPLVPWSIAGVYMSSILGVPVLDYAPWAIMCYCGIVVAWIYGFSGFGIATKVNDDEARPGS